MDTRFTNRILFADGTLNQSTPRTDGRKGTAFYGTLHVNLQHPAILAAIAEGKTSVALDLSVWERTRRDGSGTFYGVQSDRLYSPEAKAEAQQAAAG